MVLRTKLSPLGGSAEPFNPGEVIFESSIAGSYDFKFPKGRYKLITVGAGGGGGGLFGYHSNFFYGAQGGSGAYAEIEKCFPEFQALITVGTKGVNKTTSGGSGTAGTNTTISHPTATIISGGGQGGSGGAISTTMYGGAGGTNVLNGVEAINIDINGVQGANAYNGGYNTPLPSVFPPYGQGGGANGGYPSTDGYVKIIYMGKK